MRLYDAGFFDARVKVANLLRDFIKAAPKQGDMCFIDAKHFLDLVLNLAPTLHISPDMPQTVRNHDDHY